MALASTGSASHIFFAFLLTRFRTNQAGVPTFGAPAFIMEIMSGTRIHIPTARRAGVVTYEYAGWPRHITYIGRRWTMGGYNLAASPWANPYAVRRYGRERAVALYREYILTSPALLSRLGELEGKTLACWCKPDERCHGDVLLELLQR